jgi:hypothetical protein
MTIELETIMTTRNVANYKNVKGGVYTVYFIAPAGTEAGKLYNIRIKDLKKGMLAEYYAKGTHASRKAQSVKISIPSSFGFEKDMVCAVEIREIPQDGLEAWFRDDTSTRFKDKGGSA